MNQVLSDGSPNPNLGRPYVANATSGGEDNNYQTTTTRQTYRFTPTYEFRSADLFGNSTLAWILGKSDFTGLYEKNTVVQDTYQFAEYATTPQFRPTMSSPPSTPPERASDLAAASSGWPTSDRTCPVRRPPRVQT